MEKTCAIVFSNKRPMQCDLLLKSLWRHCLDGEFVDKYVIYKSENQKFQDAYNICMEENDDSVAFIKERDFYCDVYDVFKTKYTHILFMTDDTIFTNQFSVESCVKLMEGNHNILNFSLRLGYNTKYCYALDADQGLPKDLRKIERNRTEFLLWDWTKEKYDWGYPLEVSSSILRASDLRQFSQLTRYNNPNVMEWLLDSFKKIKTNSNISACFPKSVAFSLPINKVDESNQNRAGEDKSFDVLRLLKLYEEGYRFDVTKFDGFESNSAHQETEIAMYRKEWVYEN